MAKKYTDLSGGLLANLGSDALGYDPESTVPPEEFPLLDPRTMHADYRCPSCGYRWAGQPEPAKVEIDDE